MRIARIKDGYMFKTENPECEHNYLLFYDKKSKSYRAIQTTHLYRRDEKRFKQVKSNALLYVKFPGAEVPSAVRNYHYTHNIDGKKIDINDPSVKIVSKRHLPKKLSSKIKSFAVDKYVSKSKINKRKKNSN